MKRNQHMHMHQTAAQHARPFPFSAEAITELTQAARAGSSSIPGELSRHVPRVELDPTDAVLSVIHPGGTHSSSKTLLLDIGAGGGSLLYPGFLYTDTECVIHLSTTSGHTEMLSATVAWCRVLSKGVHLVDIRWAELFDIRKFVPSSRWGELGSAGDGASSPDLNGRLLAIGVDDLEIELLRMLLKDLPVEISSVPFAGAAIDSLHDEAFDVIVLNGDCRELDHQSFIATLRHEGFVEPMVILIDRKNFPTSVNDKGMRFLGRPLNDEEFLAAVREILLDASSGSGGSKAIVSERADNPALRKSIGTFVRHAQGLRQKLRSAIISDNTEEARKCLVLLNNTAPGFGFNVLCEAATEALKALDASGSAQEAGPAIKQFVRTLDRLQAPSESADAA